MASPSIDRAILITPLSHVYGAAHWPFWRRAERISNAVAGADLLHGERPMLPIRLSDTCTPIMVGRNFYRTPRFQPISLGIHCIKNSSTAYLAPPAGRLTITGNHESNVS
ncbi:hypothetical protein DARTUKUTA_21 [Bacillus phage vB_BspP_Dartukuta]|nr:hypothetical protein DARTUKUTA_21 [Bacillus phage vB_BspP_Dartukuta]